MSTYKVIGVGEHGKFFDDDAYRSAANYIFDPEKAAYVGGCNVASAETAAQEMEQTAVDFGKTKGKKVRHSVLSFDKKENVAPEQADRYAQEIIRHYAPEYQMIYAVHENTDDTHIHFVMNQISCVDGHRYQGRKKDYYDFMKHIKQVTHFPVIPVK